MTPRACRLCSADISHCHNVQRYCGACAGNMLKFRQHRSTARQRGIDWLFTYEQWWRVWSESGKWEQRGVRTGQYVMARKGDVGPYSEENVYICLATENHSHAHENGRIPFRPRVWVYKPRPKKPRKPARGWTYVAKHANRPYQVERNHRYIGSFATQEEAEAAYAAAVAADMASRAATHS